MKNKVFAIVVTYNGKQWYDLCFKSLQKSEIPLHVVVVDNASSDDTVNYIKSNYPEIKLIQAGKNLGFGKANNIGIRHALDNEADYVFLLNQDARIEPNAVIELIKIHLQNTDFGILSPMHLNASYTAIEDGLLHYLTNYKITDRSLFSDLYFNRTKDLYETKYVNAAAWLLPRKTLETVGGFDPLFFHYGEDDNYMQRALFHGFKIGICPGIKIVHGAEKRAVKKEFIKGNSKKCLLVALADINDQKNASHYIVYFCGRILRKSLKWNYRQVKQSFSDLCYVLSLRNKIKKSKIQNRKKTSSWL